MAIYAAKQGDAIETDADPIDTSEDLPDGYDPDVDVDDEDTDQPIDPPPTVDPPPGWVFQPPAFGMFWAKKESSDSSLAVQTLRNYLNQTHIAPMYDATKQAVFIDKSAVSALQAEESFEPTILSGFTWRDLNGDGFYDSVSYANTSLNIRISDVKVFNYKDNIYQIALINYLFPDSDIQPESQEVAGKNTVPYLDGTTSNTTLYYCDPAELSQYTNPDSGETTDTFPSSKPWKVYEINQYDETVTDGSGVEQVGFQFGRADQTSPPPLPNFGVINTVKTGTDGNDYFYFGIQFKVDHSVPSSGYHLGTARLLISSSLDEGTYLNIAQENYVVPNSTTLGNKQFECYAVVWLPVSTYDGERIRFHVDISFVIDSVTYFVEQPSGTYLLVANADDENLVIPEEGHEISRIGMYVHNPKRLTAPLEKLHMTYTVKGSGANIRYSWGLPVATDNTKPDWGALLTDTTLITEDTTEGSGTLTLMEGSTVTSGNLDEEEVYVIVDTTISCDFTNLGAANNRLGTTFEASSTGAPTNWGGATLLHVTTDNIGYASSDKLKPLCIWVLCKKDFDASYTSVDVQAISNIQLYANDELLEFSETEGAYVAVIGDDDNYYGVLIIPG